MKDLQTLLGVLENSLKPIKESKTLEGLSSVMIKSNVVLIRDEITDLTNQFKDTGLESVLPNIISSMKDGNVKSLGQSLSEIPEKLENLESKKF